MIRLDLPREPQWLDLPHGVRLLVRPLDTATDAAARAAAVTDLRERGQTAPPAAAKPLATQPVPAEEIPVADEVLPPASKVSVSVDQITRPGAIISGKVNFSDGQIADWYLDQTGRLGVVPKVAGYKPSAADVQEFQTALQQEIAKLGF